jgi:hypothetical protein
MVEHASNPTLERLKLDGFEASLGYIAKPYFRRKRSLKKVKVKDLPGRKNVRDSTSFKFSVHVSKALSLTNLATLISGRYRIRNQGLHGCVH